MARRARALPRSRTCCRASSRGARSYITEFTREGGDAAGHRHRDRSIVTAMLLVATVEREINAIWGVREPRSLIRRILVYALGMTAGPVLIGARRLFDDVAPRGLGGAGAVRDAGGDAARRAGADRDHDARVHAALRDAAGAPRAAPGRVRRRPLRGARRSRSRSTASRSTSRRCRPTRSSTARSPRCRCFSSGSTCRGSSCWSARRSRRRWPKAARGSEGGGARSLPGYCRACDGGDWRSSRPEPEASGSMARARTQSHRRPFGLLPKARRVVQGLRIFPIFAAPRCQSSPLALQRIHESKPGRLLCCKCPGPRYIAGSFFA